MTCTFTDPKEWLFKVEPQVQSQLWEESQLYISPTSRWCAYINQICCHAFLDWVKNEYDLEGNLWKSSEDFPAFWEFVNGTAILLNGRKVVLIPSEAVDDRELEVPQEWVDIPSWVADFYLAVQISSDGDWVRFWGYTTHQELKNAAKYDPVDRTYCMDAPHLTKDLNAFWMAFQFCQLEDCKAVISSLSELSTQRAENILERLTNSSTIPRLEVSFDDWGALLEQESYRQRLYQQRQENPQIQVSPKLNLSNWLQDIYEVSWQAIDTIFNSNSNSLAFNFRSSGNLITPSVKRGKVIDLGTEIESKKVVMVVGLTPSAHQQVTIRIQLHPFDNEYLPSNIKLILLSMGAEIIQEVESRIQDNYVQLKLFEGEAGESFSIQVILGDRQIRENFII